MLRKEKCMQKFVHLENATRTSSSRAPVSRSRAVKFAGQLIRCWRKPGSHLVLFVHINRLCLEDLIGEFWPPVQQAFFYSPAPKDQFRWGHYFSRREQPPVSSAAHMDLLIVGQSSQQALSCDNDLPNWNIGGHPKNIFAYHHQSMLPGLLHRTIVHDTNFQKQYFAKITRLVPMGRKKFHHVTTSEGCSSKWVPLRLLLLLLSCL